MGIKISYKGATGRKINMDFDGSDESLARLQQFASANSVKSRGGDASIPLKMPDEGKSGAKEKGLVALSSFDPAPGFLKDKIARDSSIEVSERDGIRLVGDKPGIAADDKLFYVRDRGKPAWKTLQNIDKGGDGIHIGPAAGDLSLEANNDELEADSKKPTTRTLMSRIAVELNLVGVNASFTIFGFTFKQTRSAMGRIISESAETRSPIASIDISKMLATALAINGGSGIGIYGVLPVISDDGALDALYFGKESDLATVAKGGEVPTAVTCVPVDTENGVLVLIGEKEDDNGVGGEGGEGSGSGGGPDEGAIEVWS